MGGVKVLGLCSGENGSFSFRYAHISRAGMQCDKVEKFLKKLCFVKGTDAKSANLPQIFQNLHSHTANTNFVACNSNPTESTPSEAEPSTECKENTESKESLESSLTESQADSESKQLTESTTPKNLNKALPNKICSAAAHTISRPCRVWQNEVSLEKSGKRWQQCHR